MKKTENTFRDYLKEQLKNKEFKKAYEEEDLIVRIAVEIASMREKHHMTQKEFAKRLHTSQQSISRIEQGDQNMTIKMIERIAEVFERKPTFRFV